MGEAGDRAMYDDIVLIDCMMGRGGAGQLSLHDVDHTKSCA